MIFLIHQTNSSTSASLILIFRHLFFTAFLCLPTLAFSQENSVVDSLTALLKLAKNDTVKVNLLTDLAWELKFDNPGQANVHLDSALALSRRLGFKKGEGNTWNFKGVLADIHGNSEEAVGFFQNALNIRNQLGDRKGVASLFNNIGNVKSNLGDYFGALVNYQNSLRIREEMADSAGIIRVNYSIALIQEKMANYPEALDHIFRYLEGVEKMGDEAGVANAWNVIGNIKVEADRYKEALLAYERALAIHRKLANEWQIASVLNNIANLYDAQAEEQMEQGILTDSVRSLYQQAVSLHQEALAIRGKLEDRHGEAEIFNNMGYVLKNLGSFYKKSGNGAEAKKTWEKAEAYLLRSLKIREEEDEKAGIMEVYNGLGDVRRRQERYEEALDYTRRYFEIAKEIGDRKFQQSALKDLARLHYKMGSYKEAYEYRKEYDELRYSLFNEERIKTEERREAVYGDAKKQRAIEQQDEEIKLKEAQLRTAATVRNSLLGGAALLVLLALVMFNRNKIIRSEKQRSENLLLNILPAQTAAELKMHGKAQARQYDAVTVIFTDFKNFTQIAEKIPAETLVGELDECFRNFDEIVSRFHIEKIKTIGDAYFCAAGLPLPQPTHAEDAVRAALAMQAFMETFRQRQRAAGIPEFFCRIGIHTGPVIAGVVGQKKFAYDIWGDTVNMAARMEQSGEPNKINISQSTYELVKDQFHCTHRGKIQAKNKGEVDMFFVEAQT